MKLNKFKANTIQQYHVLEFLRKNFAPETFSKIKLIDRYTIKVVDTDDAIIHYKDACEGVIKWQVFKSTAHNKVTVGL